MLWVFLFMLFNVLLMCLCACLSSGALHACSCPETPDGGSTGSRELLRGRLEACTTTSAGSENLTFFFFFFFLQWEKDVCFPQIKSCVASLELTM